MKMLLVAIITGLFTFASAVELVLCRHQSRRLFVELQSLHEVKQGLDQEWGQLLLEQATWGAELRVEQIANDQLSMVMPSPGQVVELQ